MRKLQLALELGRATTVQLLYAPMVTTAITRMSVRLTATTALTTLWVACLSAPARGSVDSTVPDTVAASTDAATMDEVSTDGRASMDAGLKDAADLIAAASVKAVASTEAVASAADQVVFTAVAASIMEAVGFMEAVAASMGVVAATEADTGKTFQI
jgi:hypothetical protein